MEVNASLDPADLAEDVSNGTTPTFLFAKKYGDQSTVLTVMTVTIGVTGVLGNLLVVFIVYKYKTLFKQVKSTYIINQSFIDGLTSAVLILTELFTVELTESMESVPAEIFCRLWQTQFLLWGLMTSSTYNLMAIAIERYLAIVHPMWHKTSFVDTKSRASLVFIWLFGIVYVGLITIPTSGVLNRKCFRAAFWPSRAVALAVGILQFFMDIVLPFITHSLCYTRILMTLRNRCPHEDRGTSQSPKDTEVTLTPDQTKADNIIAFEDETELSGNAQLEHANTESLQTISGSVDCSEATSSTITNTSQPSYKQHNAMYRQNERAEKNVIKTLVVVTACYFVCWLPNKIHIALYVMGVTSYFGNVFQFTSLLVFANCCINPFIYIAKYDAFKKGLKALFRRE